MRVKASSPPVCDFRDLIMQICYYIPIGLMLSYSHLLWLHLIKCAPTLPLPALIPCLHFMSYMESICIALSVSYRGENKCLLSLPCSRSDNTRSSGVYLQEYELCVFCFFPHMAFYMRFPLCTRQNNMFLPGGSCHTWNKEIMSFCLDTVFHLFPYYCRAVYKNFISYVFIFNLHCI